jgi:hypothetical protein
LNIFVFPTIPISRTGGMSKLVGATTQALYYDYSETEEFYISDTPTQQLFRVPAKIAQQWMIVTPNKLVYYNPFFRAVH